MRYVRTLIPTFCLFAGLAAGQAPAPAAAPAKPVRPTPVAAPRALMSPDQAPMPAPAAPRALMSPDQMPFPAVAPLPAYGNLDWQFQIELAQEKALAVQERALEAAQASALSKTEAVWAAQEKAFALQDRAYGQTLDAFAPRAMELEAEVARLKASADSMAYGYAFAPQFKVGTTGSEDRLYESGQRALELRRWDDALAAFTEAAAKAGSRADGAWFWKAYTLRKLGRRDESLAAIAELRKSYPNSRWLDDAKALELEVRQASGQNVAPESESDEELKLMALNGLMRSDPDRAFPILENLLKSAQSPRLKRNAVFVLAQSDTPKAAQLLEQVARGGGNPDLQVTAIRYMGEKRRQSNGPQVLAEIYAASSDTTVKRTVISSLAGARDKDRLLQIAKTEKVQDLRLEAIRNLSSIPGAQVELWQLYQSETSPEARQMILQTLPASTSTDKLLEVARTEKDAKLRRFAIQSLGSQRAAGASDALVALYGSEQDATLKRAIVDSLFAQRNAKALVQIARSEHDFKMKQLLVERLSSMKAPEATEYLMEILK